MSSSKLVPDAHKERVDRPTGKSFPNTKITESKEHYEKRHMPDKSSNTTKTYDNPALTKVTF